MTVLRFLFILPHYRIVLLSASVSAVAATLKTASLEKSLEKLRKRYDVPGMSGVIAQNGVILWTKGFGEAEIGKRSADENTVYHLASLTKPFAATVLLQLVQEGKLNLDARASDFGITFTNSDQITIRHILTHTSDGTPGAAFKYNGARFRRLDNVITNLTGRSFAEELHDRILEPLKLTNTPPTHNSNGRVNWPSASRASSPAALPRAMPPMEKRRSITATASALRRVSSPRPQTSRVFRSRGTKTSCCVRKQSNSPLRRQNLQKANRCPTPLAGSSTNTAAKPFFGITAGGTEFLPSLSKFQLESSALSSSPTPTC